ncbi:MAG: sn-glycerol-1-phosphate dehydrogenase [Casimicrobiaceae bacterium]
MSTDSRALLENAVTAASVTRVVDVDSGAIARLPGVVARLGAARTHTIVADGNTMQAAGRDVLATLRAAGVATAEPIVFDALTRLKPRVDTARALGARLRAAGVVPVAVGSGVINDVVKYAAECAGVAYVCVPTAASMDGYAASGASMLDDGFKRTLGCAPPVAVVADLDVIAAAPARMASWGYGDLSGKLVAGADWLLADALGEEAIAPVPFALVQDHVRAWLAQPARIAARDVGALRGLVNGLLVAGFAMQAHGNSRPASGSDHQIAHVWEMEGLEIDGERVAHGACVGVATVAMLAMYEWFVAQDVVSRATLRAASNVSRAPDLEAELAASFDDPVLVASARKETTAKATNEGQCAERMQRLARDWPTLRSRLRAQLVPATMLAGWLTECGAAAHVDDIGVSAADLARDYRRARLIRRRYTLLDCLDDLGWLDAAIGALFAPDGYWGARMPAERAAGSQALTRGDTR